MKSFKLFFHVFALFVLLNLTACGPSVFWHKSQFDNTRSLVMSPAFFLGGVGADMALTWDGTMPEGTSFGKITLEGEHSISKDTKLNINADGKKMTVKLLDVNKTSNIQSNPIYMTNKMSTSTVNKTILYFQLPDDIIRQVSISHDTFFMINFANHEQITLNTKFDVKNGLAMFYEKKYNDNKP